MPSNQRQIIEHAKLAYSPLGKAFERQKNNWRSRQKVNKTIEDHGKQLAESNELIKKDFDVDWDIVPLNEQKNI